MRIVLVTALALVAAGCGAGEVREGGAPPASASPPPAAGRPGPEDAQMLYEATTTVLEADGGPMLCLGGVMLSLPPQCGDVPVVGWSWDAVDGEERASGVRWGEFHVVGTYDRERFTLAGAAPPRPQPAEPDDGLTPPCPEPEGGWLAGAAAAPSQDETGSAEAYTRRQSEYVASWVHHVGDPRADEYEEELPVVYVAVFTRDAHRHEAALRERWRGPLCVVERPVPSAREARRIRAEAEASLDELGLQMLGSSEGDVGVAAEIQVVADPGGEGQAALDARFGPGLIRLVPALRPVG